MSCAEPWVGPNRLGPDALRNPVAVRLLAQRSPAVARVRVAQEVRIVASFVEQAREMGRELAAEEVRVAGTTLEREPERGGERALAARAVAQPDVRRAASAQR